MSGPGGDLVTVLERWESAGGVWRILARSEAWITVGLFTCDGGEQMSRVTGRSVDLGRFLDGRSRSDESP
jgi:hypothetical protein